MIHRITLTSVLTILALCCTPKESSDSSKQTVLFVCTHGAARSPIAAAYFNKMAKAEGLSYEAIFRGTAPDEELTEETVVGLTADGFDVMAWKPQSINNEDLKIATHVVTFDCTIPTLDASSAKLEKWNGTPSISQDYSNARDVIKRKVEGYIQYLKEDRE